MHYLHILAERLVLAYEDEENLQDFVSFTDRSGKRSALINALRRTLEDEVSAGKLRYGDLNSVIGYRSPPRFDRAQED